jgi:hypothetical protein
LFGTFIEIRCPLRQRLVNSASVSTRGVNQDQQKEAQASQEFGEVSTKDCTRSIFSAWVHVVPQSWVTFLTLGSFEGLTSKAPGFVGGHLPLILFGIYRPKYLGEQNTFCPVPLP